MFYLCMMRLLIMKAILAARYCMAACMEKDKHMEPRLGKGLLELIWRFMPSIAKDCRWSVTNILHEIKLCVFANWPTGSVNTHVRKAISTEQGQFKDN